MNKFTDFLFKFRIVVIAAVFALTALCGWLITKVTINSDISSYLPHDSTVAETMAFLEDTFGLQGDALVVFEGDLSADGFAKAGDIIDKIYAVDDVSDAGMWLGSMAQMSGGDVITLLTTPDSQLAAMENGQVLLVTKSVLMNLAPTFYSGSLNADTNAYSSDGGYYIAYLSLDVSSRDQRAYDAIDNISALLENEGVEYHLGGTSVETKAMMESALGDMPSFLIVAVLIIFVILLITTKSWLDPFIFLITIGVAILINLGTNIIFPSVSSVTFAVAAILQLALSIDYSIFLTHAYNDELALCGDEFAAMGKALKKTLLTVSGSALTTIAGFCALFAMRFTLGFNLGMVLAKGVLLSLVAVCFFQPCLILVMRKLTAKTKHKFLSPKFENAYKIPRRGRFVFIGVALALLVSTFVVQFNVDYYSLTTEYNENAEGAQAVYQNLGSRQVVVVPGADDEAKQQAFLSAVENLTDADGNKVVNDVISMEGILDGIYGAVNSLLGDMTVEGIDLSVNSVEELKNLPDLDVKIYGIINQMISQKAGIFASFIIDSVDENSNGTIDTPAEVDNLANNRLVQSSLSPEELAMLQQAGEGLRLLAQPSTQAMLAQLGGVADLLQNRFVKTSGGENYTFYYIYTVGQPESDEAIAALTAIQKVYAEMFPGQEILSAGSTQTVMDMESITGTDFTIVSALSALLIFVIVAAVFRSPLKALLITLVIETGIFINLSFTVILGVSINFMTYLIISAIQLGATVDYAILMTNKFIEAQREGNDVVDSVKRAMSGSIFSIMVSVAILASACLSVFFISGDMIIREITLMIATGSVLSGILVVFVVPSILLFFKKPPKTAARRKKNRAAAEEKGD